MLPRPNVPSLIRGFLGGFLGISVLLLIGYESGVPAIMAPFGATCVLLFALPNAPLAQPRSVIGGHVISAFIGLLCINTIGAGYLSIAFSVGLSISMMQFFRVLHAPAGANPLLIIMSGVTDFSFLLTPVLLGAALLVLVATLVNNIGVGTKWPNYWLGINFKKNIK
ncbi:TPA: HPP family protein [Providencia rettgeri]|nr:HPP family protein [Providencia rettgeri]